LIKDSDAAVTDNAVTVATVKASDLIALKIAAPTLEVQQRIANILDAKLSFVYGLHQTLRMQLETIEKMPAALLKQAFNGEL
jgi:type I restriction enzyme, S subunit